MVDRVLFDINGLKISKPGIDVKSAGDFDLLFSPKFRPPTLISKGAFSITNVFGNEVVNSVNYGATYNPPPYVVAVASAPSWQCEIDGSHIYSAFSYLNSQWHTPIIEWPNAGKNSIYTGGTWVISRSSGITGTDYVIHSNWASAKFIIRIFNNRVDFAFNGAVSGATCKYAILDIS
jgi:hypothetical protein